MNASNKTPSQSWDAALYDERHGFVWKHGEALVELLHPLPGERILDLGCGTGHLTAKFAESGTKVVGVDSSEEMLAQARAVYPALSFMQADAREFQFNEPFDAVFSNAVLHWIREPAMVARSVRSSLKVGGRFVAEFGGKRNVAHVIASLKAAAKQVRLPFPEVPWYFPNIAEYATVLEGAGLEVRFAALFDRPTPLEGPLGLRSWVTQFGNWMVKLVPEDRRNDFLTAMELAARANLFRDGSWMADYRRLRIVAVRTE